jgi:hypothetical protein
MSRSLLQCIEGVLRHADTPLLPQQVFSQILAANFYPFPAKAPLGIFRNCLSRHSVQNKYKRGSSVRRFHRFGGHFANLDELRQTAFCTD